MSTNNPHLAHRTIREWLELIPFDRARKEAIENYDPKRYGINGKADSLSEAIDLAFIIGDSPQGTIYWIILIECLYRMEQSVKLKQKDHGASFGMGY
jgi:hypothetical protein